MGQSLFPSILILLPLPRFLHKVPLKIAFAFIAERLGIQMMNTEKFDLKSHLRMFGRAVVNMRENVRMSQKELARRSGISLRLLTRIENGTARGDRFGLTEICKIADSMKARPHELMHEFEKVLNAAGEAWW